MAGEIGEDKPKDIKCKHCGKDIRHDRLSIVGTNQRSPKITDDACKALGVNKFKHRFYRQKNENLVSWIKSLFTLKEINATKDLFLAVPDAIEGHHLITCEAVSDGFSGSGVNKTPIYGKWYKLFYRYGYDVNCPQNAILLPGDMLVSCHYRVPLHMGNHEATSFFDFNSEQYICEKNYVTLVKNMVSDMQDEYTYDQCGNTPAEDIKNFHNKMLTKSNFIFNRIINFDWLISCEGMHYRPESNIGCLDVCRTITQKKELLEASVGNVSKGKGVAKFLINLTNAYTGGGCPNKRDHYNEGCKTITPINWEAEGKYMEKDQNIENLKDEK